MARILAIKKKKKWYLLPPPLTIRVNMGHLTFSFEGHPAVPELTGQVGALVKVRQLARSPLARQLPAGGLGNTGLFQGSWSYDCM